MDVVEILQRSIFTIFILAAPVLIAALLVGLIVAILQATTSIQEQTLTFVPKIFTILGILALLGSWMFTVLREFTIEIFSLISRS